MHQGNQRVGSSMGTEVSANPPPPKSRVPPAAEDPYGGCDRKTDYTCLILNLKVRDTSVRLTVKFGERPRIGGLS